MVLEKVDVNTATESATAQFYVQDNGKIKHVGSIFYNGNYQFGSIQPVSPVDEMWEMILSAPIIQPLPESEQE